MLFRSCWDGSGYPDGLRGEEIPIGARILSVVDCLDAVASNRQYRKGLPLDEAMKVVEQEAGRRYDPRVVQVLSQHYRDLDRRARSLVTEDVRLHRDLKVMRGAEPAAGFATVRPDASTGAFLRSIGAARREAQLIYEMTQVLVKSLSLPEMLAPVAARLKEVVPFDVLTVLSVRDEILVPDYATGNRAECFSGVAVPLGEGLSGWVAANRQPIVNGNPAVEFGYDPGSGLPHRSALSIPLEGSQGILGALSIHSETEALMIASDRARAALGWQPAFGLDDTIRMTLDWYRAAAEDPASLFVLIVAFRGRRCRFSTSAMLFAIEFKDVRKMPVLSVCREYDPTD